MDICIDFDGTCVVHNYPYIGAEIGAAPILRELVNKGHRIILFTMRSGKELKEAYNWFLIHKIEVYGINTNPTQVLWTTSPKAYAQLYIDDAALGIPLSTKPISRDPTGKLSFKKERPYVDWSKVKKLLIEKGIL